MTDSLCIQAHRIDGSQAGPHLMIFGGVHGDEFEPMAAVRRLAQVVTQSSLRGRLTLAPVVNEPAFVRGQRVAEDGLDLARTFSGRAEILEPSFVRAAEVSDDDPMSLTTVARRRLRHLRPFRHSGSAVVHLGAARCRARQLA